MNRWKQVACLMLLTSLLLSACSAFTPLATKDEVLTWLSERYGGTEFVILETIDGSEYERKDRPKVQLYRAAPIENQEHPFGFFHMSGNLLVTPCRPITGICWRTLMLLTIFWSSLIAF